VNGEPVDDEEDDREDFVFTSPIDNMDVTRHFLEALEELRARDVHTVSALQASLNADDQERLRNLVGKVETRRREAGNQGT
jgi:hypothetical protein